MIISNQRERIKYFIAYSLLFIGSFIGNLYFSYHIVSPLDAVFSDMGGYIEQGISFIHGHYPLNKYDTIYPPGIKFLYGSVFKLFGLNYGFHAIIVMYALMLAAINVLVGLTAFELFGRRFHGFLLSIIVTAYWPFLGLIGYYMAELPVIFLMIFAQYFFVRAVNRGAHFLVLFNIGIVLGFALFLKGQAICAFLAVWIVLLLLKVGYARRLWIVFLTAGFFLPVGLLMISNHKLNPEGGYYVAAYDGYNLFLGQSRRQGIGALEEGDVPGAFGFHVFANDTKDPQNRFLLPSLEGESIINRNYYRDKAIALIKEDPMRQLQRAVVSVRELFITGEGWPFDVVPSRLGEHQTWHEWRMILVAIPAVLSILLAVFGGYYRWQIFLIALPVLGMMGLAVLYSGQPRYVLPFQYQIFILALPAYMLRIGRFRKAWS